MLRNAVRAGLICLAAACLLPAAGCSTTNWCNTSSLDDYCDTSKCCRHCCGVCCYSNKVHTLYDPCCRSCYGIAYSGGGCTCKDEIKDRVNQVTDIFLP